MQQKKIDTQKDYGNVKKQFNFKYIAIALIFFIDFNIDNLDILPNFIGVLLILKGLGKIHFINETIAEARVLVKSLLAVSLVKFAAGILYFLFADGRSIDYASLSMMITFIFVLFETVLFVLIFRKIVRGLEQLTFMCGTFESTANVNTVTTVMNIFFIIKGVLTFAVQAPTLLADVDLDYWSERTGTFLTRAGLRNMLLPPAFIIVVLLGIFMLSIAMPFFFGLAKDKKLQDFVESKIMTKLTEDFFFRLRLNLKVAFAFFTAALIFFIDIRFVYHINILPDVFVCILLFFGVSQIAGNDRDMINKKLNRYLLLNIPISLAAYIMQTFFSVHIFYAFADEMPALNQFRVFADIVYYISVILFVLIFIEFYYFIRKLQYKHMEFSSEYLNKYFVAEEKVLYKDKTKVFIFGGIIFSIKMLATLQPRDDGLVPFLYSCTLIVFSVWAIRALALIREDICNYYT